MHPPSAPLYPLLCPPIYPLQGTDGRERGEDDTAFEKQSALFAMAAADVLLVNMWCHDIGRETGAGKPLLKVVFQARLHSTSPPFLRRRFSRGSILSPHLVVFPLP